jgi:hypothetical protein
VTASINRRLDRLEQLLGQPSPSRNPTLERLRGDPALLMLDSGLTPDPWQRALICSRPERVLLLTSRQAGKSSTAAAVALLEALLRPRSLTLLLSPSERQSAELASKLFAFYDQAGRPVPARKRTQLQLQLANGSRVVALPENEKTVRGYSGASLLVIDEAARVSDALYSAVRPMLAVSKGRLMALSTAFGRRGFFFTEWTGSNHWQRVEVTADRCPRIAPAFLEQERASLGERWFRQEYQCIFEDVSGALFSQTDIAAALTPGVQPLFTFGRTCS